MRRQALLIAVFAAWLALVAGIVFAGTRGLFRGSFREALTILTAVATSTLVPLTWLGLTEQLGREARGLFARLLGHWIGALLLIVVLGGTGVALFVVALPYKLIHFQCAPSGLLLFADGALQPDACVSGTWLRPGAKLLLNATNHLPASGRLGDAPFVPDERGLLTVALEPPPRIACRVGAVREAASSPICPENTRRVTVFDDVQVGAERLPGGAFLLAPRVPESGAVLLFDAPPCEVGKGESSTEEKLALESRGCLHRLRYGFRITICEPTPDATIAPHERLSRLGQLTYVESEEALDETPVRCAPK